MKLTTTHAHALDLASEAEILFRRIAEELALEIVLTNAPVELSMEFPRQEKLAAPVWVSLQGDSLQFDVEDFSCEMFPYELVVTRFESYLRSYLKGESRIKMCFRKRDGKVFRSSLQMNEKGRWKTIYRYGQLINIFPTLNYGVQFESSKTGVGLA